MNAGMTDKKPAGPATHSADYNDPDADIVLVSQDNMSFDVMDYYLLASSTFFRDMLENKALSTSVTQKSDDATTKITLNLTCGSFALKTLLDFVHGRPITCDLRRYEYELVLQLCDQWGFDSVVERIAWRLDKIVAEAPWEIFCIAARLDDVKLAKAALAVMKEDKQHGASTLATLSYAAISKCSLPYYVGLVRTCVGVQHDSVFDQRRGGYVSRIDWEQVATKSTVAS